MSMKDAPAKSKKRPDFVGGINEVSGDVIPKEQSALSDNIARLETSLATEKEKLLEERFWWICVATILFDVLAISAVDGSMLFVLIFLLELIVLAGLAKKYGLDWAEQMIGQLLHWVSKWGKDK